MSAGRTPTPEQQKIIDAYLTKQDLVIEAGAGTGKALRSDQPVLTPTGWKPIASLSMGDPVIGRDGLTYKVSGVYPQGVRPLYEVQFSDDVAVIADAEHRWFVQSNKQRDRGTPGQVVTTAEILNRGVTRQGGGARWFVPMPEPVQLPKADLPLEPWLLGVLLGDGNFPGTVTVSNPDREIVDRVRSLVEPLGVTMEPNPSDPITYRLGGRQVKPGYRGFWNPIVDALRSLGMRNALSHQKWVPEVYRMASADQRLELLRGLFDTDGSRAAKNAVEYTTTSKRLADDVVWLVQSLGGTARVTEKPTTRKLAYRVYAKLPSQIVPFSLSRKADGWERGTRLSPYRAIRAIAPVEAAEAVCISVTAPDELYLTAGCVPTHNTTTLKMLATATPGRTGTYIAYNKAIAQDAKRDFPRNVTCSTAHGLAYRAVGSQYRHRLDGARVPAAQAARILRINEPLKIGDKILNPTKITYLVMETVKRFCNSNASDIKGKHVPRKPGLDSDGDMQVLRTALLPLARRAWEDLTMRDGRLRFEHRHYLKCQPPGTLVTVTRRVGPGQKFTEVPIEQIEPGDKVATWGGPRLGNIRRTGRSVTHVGKRHYEGQLVTVRTSSGASSSYTHDHICVASIGDAMDGKTIVYLMRRGADYRVGRVMWRYGSQDNTLGLVSRIRMQGADAAWVLSCHDSDRRAALAEALAQHEYGIPGWQFRSLNEAMPLDEFWAKAGDNYARAAACLRAHGRDPLYPLWEQGGEKLRARTPMLVRACNLMDGMRVCEVGQVEPDSRGMVTTGGWTRAWQSTKVTRAPYSGPVHSIEVDVDHTYIADGIVTHNCWELSDPRLPADIVFLDEGQDANPVIASIFEKQTHAQRVIVGDRNQAIYGWNGAVDAMSNFLGQRLQLSQSFRFGPAVADEANKWLTWLGAELRLSGFQRINSVVESADFPDAILCRTNAEALGQAMSAMRDGISVALVGGGAGLRRMAEAAVSLKAGLGTDHPELFAFTSWAQVQDYVDQDPDAEDLAGVVKLIDEFGPDVLIEAVDQLSSERYAKLVISTAHKAKGREWDTVQIAPDFREPKPNPDGSDGAISDEEAMLSYVAVTRAKLLLDRGPLKYIDNRLGLTV